MGGHGRVLSLSCDSGFPPQLILVAFNIFERYFETFDEKPKYKQNGNKDNFVEVIFGITKSLRFNNL